MEVSLGRQVVCSASPWVYWTYWPGWYGHGLVPNGASGSVQVSWEGGQNCHPGKCRQLLHTPQWVLVAVAVESLFGIGWLLVGLGGDMEVGGLGILQCTASFRVVSSLKQAIEVFACIQICTVGLRELLFHLLFWVVDAAPPLANPWEGCIFLQKWWECSHFVLPPVD